MRPALVGALAGKRSAPLVDADTARRIYRLANAPDDDDNDEPLMFATESTWSTRRLPLWRYWAPQLLVELRRDKTSRFSALAHDMVVAMLLPMLDDLRRLQPGMTVPLRATPAAEWDWTTHMDAAMALRSRVPLLARFELAQLVHQAMDPNDIDCRVLGEQPEGQLLLWPSNVRSGRYPLHLVRLDGTTTTVQLEVHPPAPRFYYAPLHAALMPDNRLLCVYRSHKRQNAHYMAVYAVEHGACRFVERVGFYPLVCSQRTANTDEQLREVGTLYDMRVGRDGAVYMLFGCCITVDDRTAQHSAPLHLFVLVLAGYGADAVRHYEPTQVLGIIHVPMWPHVLAANNFCIHMCLDAADNIVLLVRAHAEAAHGVTFRMHRMTRYGVDYTIVDLPCALLKSGGEAHGLRCWIGPGHGCHITADGIQVNNHLFLAWPDDAEESNEDDADDEADASDDS
jgi:hypothetical protein